MPKTAKKNKLILLAVFSLLLLGIVLISTLRNNPQTRISKASSIVNDVSGGTLMLSIDRSKIDSPLTDLPILVHLATSSGINSFDASRVFTELGNDDNRKKISATSSDGAQLYVEIEKWDTANNEALLWVKIPSISNTSDTVIYLNYNKNMADNTAYVGDIGSAPAQNVWTNGFVAVQHLSESGSGVAGEYLDSTGRGNSGQGGPNATPVREIGKIGYGQLMDGVNDYITIPDSDDFSIPTTNALTISYWINPHEENPDPLKWTRFFMKGYNSSDTGGNWEWYWVWQNLSANNPPRIRFYVSNLSGGQGAGDGAVLEGDTQAIVLDKWIYLTATAHTSDETCHNIAGSGRGKEEVYSGPAIGPRSPDCWLSPTQGYDIYPANGPAPITYGGRGPIDDYFWASFDEVRISNVVRSTAWIKASYHSDSDSLISYADLTIPPTPTLTPITTDTPTPVASSTPIPVPTSTPTADPTPTPTSTPIPVPTSTPTADPTPTPTSTPIPVPTSTPTPASTNPAAYWKFEEAAGTITYDSSGNENTGVIKGASWTSGKIGKALSFDGKNDYVDVGNGPNLNITGNKITIEAWIYPKSLSEKYIISKSDGDAVTSGYNLFITKSNIYFRLGNGTTRYQFVKAHGMSTNKWYHIVAVYDGATMKIYKNGVALSGSTAFSGNIGLNSFNVNIGQRVGNGNNWNGYLDEVKIYNRDLSPSEIMADYNAGLTSNQLPASLHNRQTKQR